MAKRETARNARSVTKPMAVNNPAATKEEVQEALQVTFVLKGDLKNARIAYIRAGKRLADVRDRKLYERLKDPDIESYAMARLKLGRSSLYRYLQIYDWIAEFHKEWLEPKPKGFIPEFEDADDLRWIEYELKRTDLEPEKRAALEALREKAMAGDLREHDLDDYRKRGNSGADGLKAFLSKLRNLRMRGAALESMPLEVISHLDDAIEILKNEHTLQLAGIELLEPVSGRSRCGKFLA